VACGGCTSVAGVGGVDGGAGVSFRLTTNEWHW